MYTISCLNVRYKVNKLKQTYNETAGSFTHQDFYKVVKYNLKSK